MVNSRTPLLESVLGGLAGVLRVGSAKPNRRVMTGRGRQVVSLKDMFGTGTDGGWLSCLGIIRWGGVRVCVCVCVGGGGIVHLSSEFCSSPGHSPSLPRCAHSEKRYCDGYHSLLCLCYLPASLASPWWILYIVLYPHPGNLSNLLRSGLVTDGLRCCPIVWRISPLCPVWKEGLALLVFLLRWYHNLTFQLEEAWGGGRNCWGRFLWRRPKWQGNGMVFTLTIALNFRILEGRGVMLNHSQITPQLWRALILLF